MSHNTEMDTKNVESEGDTTAAKAASTANKADPSRVDEVKEEEKPKEVILDECIVDWDESFDDRCDKIESEWKKKYGTHLYRTYTVNIDVAKGEMPKRRFICAEHVHDCPKLDFDPNKIPEYVEADLSDSDLSDDDNIPEDEVIENK